MPLFLFGVYTNFGKYVSVLGKFKQYIYIYIVDKSAIFFVKDIFCVID